MANQAHKRMFVNDLYVTIIRRGFQGKVGMAEKATSFFRKRLGVDGRKSSWRPSGNCATSWLISAKKWQATGRKSSAAECATAPCARKSASS